MKKLLLSLAVAAFVWVSSTGTSAGNNGFACWQRCTECKNRGADSERCNDLNILCCEAQGKKSHYKTCGCY